MFDRDLRLKQLQGNVVSFFLKMCGLKVLDACKKNFVRKYRQCQNTKYFWVIIIVVA